MSKAIVKTQSLKHFADYSNGRVEASTLDPNTFVGVDNLLQNKMGKIPAEYVPSAGNVTKYNNGDTLIGNIRPYLKKIWFANNTGGSSPDVLTLHAKDGVDSRFLYYNLLQDSFFDYVMAAPKGTQMPRGDKNRVLEFQIPNFEIGNQQKIASVLSTFDTKIGLNNKINSELEQIAETLFNYWFVQFDFPDANGKPYKSCGGKMVWNEELKKEIPVEWEKGTISSLLEFNPTLSIRTSELASYVDMDALPTVGFMTKEIKKKKFLGGMKFQNGDLVIARITPCLENGKTSLITLLDENEIGFGSTEFIVIRGKNRSLSGFASFLARSELFRKFAITNMVGTSGRKRVDASALEKFKLAIPTDSILDRFEEITKSFFDRATINTKQNQQLIQLRDWLLPMLMNGQVTVAD